MVIFHNQSIGLKSSMIENLARMPIIYSAEENSAAMLIDLFEHAGIIFLSITFPDLLTHPQISFLVNQCNVPQNYMRVL